MCCRLIYFCGDVCVSFGYAVCRCYHLHPKYLTSTRKILVSLWFDAFVISEMELPLCMLDWSSDSTKGVNTFKTIISVLVRVQVNCGSNTLNQFRGTVRGSESLIVLHCVVCECSFSSR
jgi:hypothetical protein